MTKEQDATAPSTALRHPGRAFDDVLREAITARGLALTRVRDHLAGRGQQVGVSTLSYWQNGERQPTSRSLPVIEALEQVLALAPTTLTALIPTDGERGVRPSRFANLTGYADTVDQLVEQMQTIAPGQTASLSIIDGITIGSNGSLETRHVHQVIRAVDEVDRLVLTHQGEIGCDTTLLTVESVSGCRIGRVGRDADHGLMVSELLFDRTLRRHEVHVLQYLVKDGNSIPSREYYRIYFQRGGMHVAELAFHPDLLPVRVEEFQRPRLDDPDTRRRPAALYDGNRVHLVTEQQSPGIAGLTWEYE